MTLNRLSGIFAEWNHRWWSRFHSVTLTGVRWSAGLKPVCSLEGHEVISHQQAVELTGFLWAGFLLPQGPSVSLHHLQLAAKTSLQLGGLVMDRPLGGTQLFIHTRKEGVGVGMPFACAKGSLCASDCKSATVLSVGKLTWQLIWFTQPYFSQRQTEPV